MTTIRRWAGMGVLCVGLAACGQGKEDTAPQASPALAVTVAPAQTREAHLRLPRTMARRFVVATIV